AAVIGRMEHYGRMYIAAVVFGIVETAIIFNKNSGALIDPVIFVVLITFLLLQRRQRESRVADQAISTWDAASNVRPIPRELRDLPEVRWGLRIGAAVLLGGLVLLPYGMGDARTNLAAA